MWKELNLEQMAEEENGWLHPRPPEEIEPIIVMVRLDLYNRMQPCGVKALRRRLDRHYHVKPLPSERTIRRILVRNNLIERR